MMVSMTRRFLPITTTGSRRRCVQKMRFLVIDPHHSCDLYPCSAWLDRLQYSPPRFPTAVLGWEFSHNTQPWRAWVSSHKRHHIVSSFSHFHSAQQFWSLLGKHHGQGAGYGSRPAPTFDGKARPWLSKNSSARVGGSADH